MKLKELLDELYSFDHDDLPDFNNQAEIYGLDIEQEVGGWTKPKDPECDGCMWEYHKCKHPENEHCKKFQPATLGIAYERGLMKE